jgi:hypothetical protein
VDGLDAIGGGFLSDAVAFLTDELPIYRAGSRSAAGRPMGIRPGETACEGHLSC